MYNNIIHTYVHTQIIDCFFSIHSNSSVYFTCVQYTISDDIYTNASVSI